jgi:heme-degrading monooxygenase HmoA
MISRIWRGWTDPANADAYEEMLRSVVLPGISDRVNGYLGVYLLRRDHEQEVEFVTVTMFASYDAVRSFAGADYERAVLEPEAKQLLSRYDERVAHYETVLAPD